MIHHIRSDCKQLSGQMLHYLLEQAIDIKCRAKKEGE